MFKIIQLLIFGHVHEWETVEVVQLTCSMSGAKGSRYILRCKKCGAVKKKDLI